MHDSTNSENDTLQPMIFVKTKTLFKRTLKLGALVLGLNAIPAPGGVAQSATSNPVSAPAKTAEAIPWSQIGTKAGTDYKGDGLWVIPTDSGVQLHCVFQRMNGETTPEGNRDGSSLPPRRRSRKTGE